MTAYFPFESFIFGFIASLVFGYSSYRLFLLLKLMQAHQGKTNRFDHLLKRLVLVLINVFGQKAVLKKPVIGMAHTIIFWGFLIISLGTLEQFITTLNPQIEFYLLLGKKFYSLLSALQDVLTGGVLLAVGYAFYRRLVLKPPGLGKSHDALLILIFTASLMIAILGMNAFRLLAVESGSLRYSFFPNKNYFPISSILLPLFQSFFPASPETFDLLGETFKWIHMLIVLGFSAYIPSSKHLHILAAGPNTFFQNLQTTKAMPAIDFEDETNTNYGVGKINEFSWKDALDYYSCTECGRCQDVCPAHHTDKPLSPKQLIIHLKQNLFHNQEAVLKHQPEKVGSVIDHQVTQDVIWSCTSCRACEVACPVFIEHTDKIYAIRRNLVMMESQFPTEVQAVFKNMETNASPWAFSSADRAKWAEGLNIPIVSQNPTEFDLLLWVGCAGSYDDRNKKVVKAFVSLLEKAGVKFAILGNEEKCTGDPARRIGNEYLYQTLAKSNIETLNRYKIKKIVTTCPHCFNTIKNEYSQFNGHYEVIHHSEMIASLIQSGKLKPSKQIDQSLTFHDSCYLGRWNGIYDAPRTILSQLPGTEIREMESNQEKSLCCGAGGGRMWMEEKLGTRINQARAQQAIKTQADTVVSSCPFCMTMLTDGIGSSTSTQKPPILDIAEVVQSSL